MKKERAVFLDRDGTISEEGGYINHPDRLLIYPWSAEAIRKINAAGMRTIVVTNQSGVARGYFNEDIVIEINQKLKTILEAEGAILDDIYYCPHHAETGQPPYKQNCTCRKPKPGLLLKAAEKFNIDLTQSYVIGDRFIEIELAKGVGATSIFVLSGYGKIEYHNHRERWPYQPDYIADNLLEGVKWVLDGHKAT